MRRLTFALSTVLLAATAQPARSGPLCSDAAVFPVPLSSFVSCVVQGENDFLEEVQAALDQALSTDITLSGQGSFSPGPGSSGAEFTGTDLTAGFDIGSAALGDNIAFTFEQLPPGTQFIALKQGNAFEVFKVPGNVPFTLEHQLGGESTGHISTFVPEPAVGLLVVGGLLGLGLRRTARRR
jgi:hypothetical protein